MRVEITEEPPTSLGEYARIQTAFEVHCVLDETELEDGEDIAILWDIRVSPEMRGRGVGGALFRAVEEWAVARTANRLIVETQNTNVAACRFYIRNGCYLGCIRRGAYVELPDEVQLLWYKDLSS